MTLKWLDWMNKKGEEQPELQENLNGIDQQFSILKHNLNFIFTKFSNQKLNPFSFQLLNLIWYLDGEERRIQKRVLKQLGVKELQSLSWEQLEEFRMNFDDQNDYFDFNFEEMIHLQSND